jgi:hypothetical protein
MLAVTGPRSDTRALSRVPGAKAVRTSWPSSHGELAMAGSRGPLRGRVQHGHECYKSNVGHDKDQSRFDERKEHW